MLPPFSKLLKRLVRNRLYKHLSPIILFNDKKIGFQSSKLTELEVIVLIRKMLDDFNKNKYKQVIFIDLIKAFGIIDHDKLLK